MRRGIVAIRRDAVEADAETGHVVVAAVGKAHHAGGVEVVAFHFIAEQSLESVGGTGKGGNLPQCIIVFVEAVGRWQGV